MIKSSIILPLIKSSIILPLIKSSIILPLKAFLTEHNLSTQNSVLVKL